LYNFSPSAVCYEISFRTITTYSNSKHCNTIFIYYGLEFCIHESWALEVDTIDHFHDLIHVDWIIIGTGSKQCLLFVPGKGEEGSFSLGDT